MQDEDTKFRLLALSAKLLRRTLNILLQFPNGILQRGPRVVDFIDYKHALPNKVRHFQTAQIEPLRARHLGSRLLNAIRAKLFVER